MEYTTGGAPKRELLLKEGTLFLAFLWISVGLTLLPHLLRQLRTRLKEEGQGHNLMLSRGVEDRVETTGWPNNLTRRLTGCRPIG